MTKTITCRYGVTYKCEAKGTRGELARLWHLLSECCCWVCHNRQCKTPRNEVVDGCGEICGLWTKTPWCKKEGDAE